MIRSILVPLDGSSIAERALPVACHIAQACGAQVRLMRIHIPYEGTYVESMPLFDEQLEARGREQARAYLERLRDEWATEQRLVITCQVVNSDEQVATAIARSIATSNVDLVVMTTHGRGGLARFWLGSVADALVRQVVVPVLLLRPDTEATERAAPLQRILIPLSGDQLAEQILKRALALGRATAAEYTLLQVIVPPAPPVTRLGTPVSLYSAGLLQTHYEEAQAYLERIAQRLQASGARVQTQVVVAAQPAEGILEYAQKHEIDLIALATHGRRGIARLLVGSVADKVMRAASVPVMLARPRESFDT